MWNFSRPVQGNINHCSACRTEQATTRTGISMCTWLRRGHWAWNWETRMMYLSIRWRLIPFWMLKGQIGLRLREMRRPVDIHCSQTEHWFKQWIKATSSSLPTFLGLTTLHWVELFGKGISIPLAGQSVVRRCMGSLFLTMYWKKWPIFLQNQPWFWKKKMFRLRLARDTTFRKK